MSAAYKIIFRESHFQLCVLSNLVAKASTLAKREFRMTWAIRSCALAAGAAALLSAQAVYAAPTPTRASAVDPLVSLSVLGTQQSRTAVCAAAAPGAACTIPAAMASTTAASAAAAAAAQDQPPPPKALGVWPILLGLAALIAVLVAITSGGSDGHGDLTPISPD
jgi:hypothetical protein